MWKRQCPLCKSINLNGNFEEMFGKNVAYKYDNIPTVAANHLDASALTFESQRPSSKDRQANPFLCLTV